jgi:MYXO-CTERM domain-containing protein
VCAPFECSVQLGLCFDRNTGYVRDPATNDWALPPPYAGCGPGQVYWPKFGDGLCYDPNSGYIWNTQTNRWEFYGIDFVERKEFEAEDSSCDVSGTPGHRHGWSWAFVGLLGAAYGLSYRRRAR